MGRRVKSLLELTPEKEAELRARILSDKNPRAQMEIKAYWALTDLSKFYKEANSPLYYRVNRLIHELANLFPVQLESKGGKR